MSEALPPLPASHELVAIFDHVVGRWHDRESAIDDWSGAQRECPEPAGEAAALVQRLILINTFQWHEEDRSRDLGADDHVLAAVKRSIDASNRRRVQTIDDLDAWYVAALGDRQSANAPVPSETVGSIVDRLSILALKRYHVQEACDAAAAGDRNAMRTRLTVLDEQYGDLAACYDRIQADVLAGRLRLKRYRQVKVYRDAATGHLRADIS